MRKFLYLNSAQRYSDFALLLMRLFVGLFLIWGVWDNITDGARMQEFTAFLAKHGFRAPKFLPPSRFTCSWPSGWGSCSGCSRAGPASSAPFTS